MSGGLPLGQHNLEDRACDGLQHLDPSLMTFDDLADQMEPEAKAFGGGGLAATLELVEDPRPIFNGNAISAALRAACASCIWRSTRLRRK